MIHKYSMNGYNIVIDCNSGAIHIVDEIVYNILDFYKKFSKEIIKSKLLSKYSEDIFEESYMEIEELEKKGLLFSKDTYDEILPQVKKRQPVVKALCLHIAHDCNLKCKYCFAEEGEYKGKRSLMSLDVGKRAIDFIVKNSGNRKNLEIDFFGGEPLMNFNVIKGIVNYAKEKEKGINKKFRFTMTTNGILLDDEKLEYINKYMYNLVLSLDGRKEVNDMMRVCRNGLSSYDIIVPKFQKAAEMRNQENYYIRGTYTRKNLDFSKDVMHLADLGFKQISVEPVIGEKELDYTLKDEDIEYLCKEYEKLAVSMLERKKEGKDFNFFHFMIDLEGGPCVAKRVIGCGSGTEYLAVTPEGELFPCHQFVGMDGFLMGNVVDGITNLLKRKEFENCNVYTKDGCRKCWAKFYCSGGCSANAYSNDKDILSIYKLGCDLQRKRTECAIMLKVAENYSV